MNVIHLLPDSVANQIAAGEVIQRPASVIKELMENAIDAGASDVKVIVQDAGRTQIQVIDNGCGMNESDARLAFERHATSKIANAQDLYALQTMGFRGEALASIAAVAQVELLTRQADAELGVRIEISGAEILKQEPCATPVGSRFCVKNLFFNVPARRRFLKSDNVELRHITSEFLRVALAHPSIAVSLQSNGQSLFNLPAGNTKQRVAGVAGLSMAKNLLSLDCQTSIVKISGFIGTPDTARKTGGDQFFFVNNRFMRSAYFNKAVTDAYKGIIPADHLPAFFIYFDVDPQCIDVNVHPQKTEIKFDDEQAIWKILNAAIASCLNVNGILPSIDFDSGERLNIPTFNAQPDNSPENTYNPFAREQESASAYADSHSGEIILDSGQYSAPSGTSFPANAYDRKPSVEGWENLYKGLEKQPPTETNFFAGTTTADAQQPLFPDDATLATSGPFIQIRARYIAAPTPRGLLLIDQHRAHFRILFNKLRAQASHHAVESQRLLFEEVMSLGAEDACIISELSAEFLEMGIEIVLDAEKGSLTIKSIPSLMDLRSVRDLIESLTFDCRNGEVDIHNGVQDYMLRSLSSHAAMPAGRTLSPDEMAALFSSLISTADFARTPSGKPTMRLLSSDDIDSLFRN